MISVLYIDDEPELLELGKIFLELDGTFAITTAESGLSALEIIKNANFDAIVSDYMMPEMDGISLLRDIRTISDIPFILFTGKGREEVVMEAINSGADFYLQKGGAPKAQFAELGHKIVQAVSRRRAEQALYNRLEMIRHTSVTSARFIRLSADRIDAAINELLVDIGSRAGVDHCYIAQETATRGEIAWTHAWVDPGCISLKSRPGPVNYRDISWLIKNIDDFRIVNVPSVAALPNNTEDSKKLKTWLQKIGIKSFLVLPLTSGPAVIGLLGLGTTQNEISWPDEDVDILKIYSQIIAGALARNAADKAMHESEELYRTVFESTGTAMMILNEDKTISVVNREFERISGYTRSEIVGKIPWTRFVSTDDVERMQQYHELRRANPTEVPKNYEFDFLSREGKHIGTYITVEMIPGTRKSVVSLIDISKEREAQQELAESEEKFRSLAESLPEGIYMIQDNRFVYFNPAFIRLFGHSSDYLKGIRDYTDLFIEEDRPRMKKAAEGRLAGIRNTDRYSVHGIRQDGTIITVEIHGSRTRYNGAPAIIGTVKEVGG
ncbi:MAG: PAS domain S-box protein [Methanoregula sp.]|jgi:PAS domain S-box-containing protein|nr:PAS domain S-box protein [Methanoregula sp.]